MHIARESIFVSAVRAFCSAFAGLLGIVVAIILSVIALSMFSKSDLSPSTTETKIAPDADGRRTLLSATAPVILKVDIHGVIGDGSLVGSTIQDILLDSRENLFAHDRVKGILLHINSPGGTVTDGDDIYNAILAYKKKYNVPVYTYVDGLCASGGYYIAMASEKIFASPTSIIGSVGVIMGPAFNVSQVMEKIGVQSLTMTQGKDKDMLNPFRPWVPGEDASLRAIMSATYERFVDIVTAARPHLDKNQLINTYGAQVFLSDEAQKLGYIDESNSSYEAALRALTKAAGIPETQTYQVLQLQKPENIFAQLIDSKASLLSGKITHRLELGPYMTSDMSGKLLYLYQPY